MSAYKKDQEPTSEEEDIPFREMNRKEKLATIVAITVLIVMAIGILFGIYFFGMAGIFNILGVQYDSFLSLAIFVISVFLIGIAADFLSLVFYIIFTKRVTDQTKLFLFSVGFETVKNWLVLFTVDEFMKSISIAAHTEWIIALILALIEIAFNDE